MLYVTVDARCTMPQAAMPLSYPPHASEHSAVVLQVGEAVSLSLAINANRTLTEPPEYVVPHLSSSSSELSNLFTKLRQKVFLPAYLKRAQQNLIYKKKHHNMLRAEPFVIDLGPEQFTLVPVNPLKDIPPHWQNLMRAMELMGANAADWNANYVHLLTGFKKARRHPWSQAQAEILLRKPARRGMANVVIDTARHAARTGIYLTHIRTVREVMWACRAKAEVNGWSSDATTRAISLAHQLANMLEEKKHKPDLTDPDTLDPTIQPDLIGVMLELMALRAHRHEGSPEDVKVFVQRLLPNLTSETMTPAPAANATDKPDVQANYELLRWVPVRNGLNVAKEVLGDELPQPDLVREALQALDTRIEQSRATILAVLPEAEAIPRRLGMHWYKQSLL